MNLIKTSLLAFMLSQTLLTCGSDTESTVSAKPTTSHLKRKRMSTPGTICCDTRTNMGPDRYPQPPHTISTTDSAVKPSVSNEYEQIKLLEAKNHAYKELQTIAIFPRMTPTDIDEVIADSIKTRNRIHSKQEITEHIIINCMLIEDKMGLL